MSIKLGFVLEEDLATKALVQAIQERVVQHARSYPNFRQGYAIKPPSESTLMRAVYIIHKEFTLDMTHVNSFESMTQQHDALLKKATEEVCRLETEFVERNKLKELFIVEDITVTLEAAKSNSLQVYGHVYERVMMG